MRSQSSVLHNLSALTIAQVGAQLLNLVALVYLARLLGPHWFGVVQVGVAFSAYALITAEWGLFSLGIRDVARLDQPAEVLGYARSQQGMLVVLAVVVGGVALLVLPRLPFYRQDPVVFLLYLAAIVPQIFMLEWVGLGLERATWVGLARLSTSLIYALLVLVVLRPLDAVVGWPLHRLVPVFFLLSLVGGNIVIATPVARWLGRAVWPARGTAAEWRRRWRETGPIGASIVTMRVLWNIDIIVLGLLATPAVAGAYAAAAKIAFVFVFAMEVLWKALLPRLSRLADESAADFRRGFNLYLALVLLGLVPAAVGGVLLGPELIDLLYGDRFPGAQRVFQVLAVSYPLLSVGWFFGNSLIAQDRQRAYFPPLVLSAAVTLAGNLLLVPRLGGLGASYGMLAGHALLLLSLGLIVRRQLSWRLWPVAGIIVLGIAALVFCIWSTPSWHLVARILVAGGAYLLVVAWPARRWSLRFREATDS